MKKHLLFKNLISKLINLGLSKKIIENRILNNEYNFSDAIDLLNPERHLEEMKTLFREDTTYSLQTFGFSEEALKTIYDEDTEKE